MVTKEELDLLLAGLKADVARMKPTPLAMAMATDVFWAEDPLPVNEWPQDPDSKAAGLKRNGWTLLDDDQ